MVVNVHNGIRKTPRLPSWVVYPWLSAPLLLTAQVCSKLSPYTSFQESTQILCLHVGLDSGSASLDRLVSRL